MISRKYINEIRHKLLQLIKIKAGYCTACNFINGNGNVLRDLFLRERLQDLLLSLERDIISLEYNLLIVMKRAIMNISLNIIDAYCTSK